MMVFGLVLSVVITVLWVGVTVYAIKTLLEK